MITLVANLKGGAGKSTINFNLALWLASRGVNILAYDLDPQCTLTDALEVRKEEGHSPNIKCFNRYTAPKKPVDEILIDVGTANMAGLKKAIGLADRIIIPVAPSQADVWSTQRFLYMISSIVPDKKSQREGTPPPEVIAFLNRADTHSSIRESDDTQAALESLPGIRVLPQRLCQRTAYRRSFSEGQAVFELKASSKAALEFQNLADVLYPER